MAVASAQFCPVKVCSVGTSTIIFIVGALLWWRGVNPLGVSSIRRQLREDEEPEEKEWEWEEEEDKEQ